MWLIHHIIILPCGNTIHQSSFLDVQSLIISASSMKTSIWNHCILTNNITSWRQVYGAIPHHLSYGTSAYFLTTIQYMVYTVHFWTSINNVNLLCYPYCYTTWRRHYPGGYTILEATLSWRLHYPRDYTILEATLSWKIHYPGCYTILAATLSLRLHYWLIYILLYIILDILYFMSTIQHLEYTVHFWTSINGWD